MAKNGKPKPKPRAGAEICARAGTDPYLVRLRFWDTEVRVTVLDGLTCVDTYLDPDTIRAWAAEAIAGVEAPRPPGSVMRNTKTP